MIWVKPEGAVKLQAAIDAHEGERLPLEFALYLAAELGKQATGAAPLEPGGVWLTHRGTVTTPAPPGPRALAQFTYRLLTGAADVSAWPPSYFNPEIDPALDASVMAAVESERDEAALALMVTVSKANARRDPQPALDTLARWVLAVPDEEEPAVAPPAPVPSARPSRPAPWAMGAAASAVLLAVALIASSVSTSAPVAVEDTSPLPSLPAPEAVKPLPAAPAPKVAPTKKARLKPKATLARR